MHYKDIENQAKTQIEDIANTLFPQEIKKNYGHEIRLKKSGSLRIFIDGPKQGQWSDFSEGSGGGPLKLIQMAYGFSFKDALNWLKDYLKIENLEKEPYKKINTEKKEDLKKDIENQEKEILQKKKNFAQKIWQESSELNKGYLYLQKRGITFKNFKDIQEKNLTNFEKTIQKIPENYKNQEIIALVLAIRDENEKICAIQQIFTADGTKLKIDIPKKTIGSLKGGAIHLGNPTDTLCLAEGPETALSIQQALNIPTWALCGTSGGQTIKIPDHIKTIYIAGDIEDSEAGIASSIKTAENLHKQHKNVEIFFPANPFEDNQKIDFNDLLKKNGEDSIKNAFDTYKIIAQNQKNNVINLAQSPKDALYAFQNFGGEAKILNNPKQILNYFKSLNYTLKEETKDLTIWGTEGFHILAQYYLPHKNFIQKTITKKSCINNTTLPIPSFIKDKKTAILSTLPLPSTQEIKSFYKGDNLEELQNYEQIIVCYEEYTKEDLQYFKTLQIPCIHNAKASISLKNYKDLYLQEIEDFLKLHYKENIKNPIEPSENLKLNILYDILSDISK